MIGNYFNAKNNQNSYLLLEPPTFLNSASLLKSLLTPPFDVTFFAHQVLSKTPIGSCSLDCPQSIRISGGILCNLTMYHSSTMTNRRLQANCNLQSGPTSLLHQALPVLGEIQLYLSRNLRHVLLSQLSQRLDHQTNIFFPHNDLVVDFTSRPSEGRILYFYTGLLLFYRRQVAIQDFPPLPQQLLLNVSLTY